MITEWNGNMHFTCMTESGHRIDMDASPEFGGEDKGYRPKELLLVGLMGCTGMDVVSLLKKMKVENFAFNLKVEYEKSEGHPIIYKKIKLIYLFSSEEDLPKDKIEKAVKLSQEKYCGVSAMLSKSSDVTYEVIFE